MIGNENRKPRILIVGSINMDLVLQLARMPLKGESLLGSRYSYVAGGKGANQAVAAGRAGAEVTFVGRVGSDTHGQKLQAGLEEAGIDTRYLRHDPEAPSGLAVIPVEEDGENRIIVYPGANMEIEKSDLDTPFRESFDAVMLNFEIPESIIRETCRRASEAEIPVVIDAGPPREVDMSDLPGIEILSPNKAEAAHLLGEEPEALEGEKALSQAAKKLSEKNGAPKIVIKLGSSGAFVFEAAFPDRAAVMPAFSVETIDGTAAGDAFTSAMAVRYLETGDLAEAVEFGAAAGAIAATKLGAQPSLAERSEIEAFLATFL
ncbi:MAG: ribokinase [Spirochaetales bacterium]|nr:ribokinase [Spirochaetales bacterium]MCF7937952.1 ribokinase [Spirochaetales bacterium]